MTEVKQKSKEEILEAIGEERYNSIVSYDSADSFAETVIKNSLAPNESEELDDAQLDMVVGGMSNWEAIKIVSVAYYDMCRYGYSDRTYSWGKIEKALNKCDKIAVKIQGWGIKTLWNFFTTGSPY